MSLQYLGISHFPVLHRQFSSPIRGSFSESSPSQQDLTQDSKDVLIERLNDLVQHLSTAQELEDGAVTAVHSQVDKIEMILRGEEKHKKPDHSRSSSAVSRDGHDPFWAPATPTKSMRMRLPDMSTGSQRPPLRRNLQELSSAKASELAQAAEDLASRLSATLEEFQRRKEESDHVHDLLITRVEKAAERILVLEYRIAEMEDDFEANQSELKFLRIQLQALEAQCAQYIPRDEDPELTESILNWKVDWEDIDKRSKERRKKCKMSLSVSNLSDSQTIVDGP
ncbi:hypothetical protein L207DRAFT_577929 [Hyaloscypha variabilis F]|uniref:Uncharacterized protein n=1 Tax=Hyaloscypha variabilis (strain UAMH 11265 / GT02V1 / F) TaxID=1149755 RepID=A0A2J6S2J4_HYAVF|nr:hypothetical protein L207DRAFT_577929 [Hyaloscypha variabilis F]